MIFLIFHVELHTSLMDLSFFFSSWFQPLTLYRLEMRFHNYF